MPNYATVGEIAKWLRYSPPSGFVGSLDTDTFRTYPSSGEVSDYIDYSEAYIDRETRATWIPSGRRVSDEYHDFPYWRFKGARFRSFYGDQGSIQLKFFPIYALSNAAGDKLEVWNGSAYENYLTTKTEGRDNDWWQDTNLGAIRFTNSRPVSVKDSVRVTYRHGESGTVPVDIKRATILLTASQVVQGDDYSVTMPEGTQNMDFKSKIEEWEGKAEEIINLRRRIITDLTSI